LAAINLFRQDLSQFDNFPRIVPRDYFDRLPGEQIPFFPARGGGAGKVNIPLPHFTAIIGNPPYLRSQNQDDLDKSYKSKLFFAAKKNRIRAASKTDLFAFFVYKSLEFMNTGTRLGFVTTASWLTADYGVPLQHLLLGRLRLVALIASNAEPFFFHVDVNTVLLIAELKDTPQPQPEETLKFITLKKPLKDLFPD
jgi:hypothetical protein